MSGAQALERGYRRLLAWYPTWHRQVHGEEMIGVLLATATGGKRRPGVAETLNILWAGLVIRLRPRATAVLPAGGWADALSVFSVAAPVALACQSLVWCLGRGFRSPLVIVVYMAFFGLGLALPLVLLRLRRVALLVSSLATVALAAYCVLILSAGAAAILAFPLFGYAAVTVALLCSAGPRRGLQLLTWRAWALTVVAGACGGVAWFTFTDTMFRATATYRPETHQQPGVLIAGTAAVVVGGAIATWVATRSALGRKVLLMFAVPLYVLLTSTAAAFIRTNLVASALLTYLPPLAAAGLGLRAALRSRRRDPDAGQPA